MCDIVQQISADQFLSLRSHVSSAHNEKLHEKKEYLLKTFSCFTAPSLPPPLPANCNNKHKRVRHEPKGNRTEKVKIGCRDLSRENFGRKDFMALMNKMTAANKDTILQSIRNVYRDDCQNIYTDITWTMMQKSPEFHDLHLSVLNTISDITDRKQEWRGAWCELSRKFVSDRQWFPVDAIVQSEDYDEFCDFVKWRKSTVSAIRALCMLEDNGWIDLPFRKSVADSIMESLQSIIVPGDKVTDALIEQLHTIVSHTSEADNGCIVSTISLWFNAHMKDTLSLLRPATRFKMYDLQELLERKMKTI